MGRVRVLLASTGGSGHVGPLLPVLSALVRWGDEVLLVVPPALAGTAGGTGQPYVLGEDPPQAELGPLWERFAVADPAEQAVLANRELFARLCTTAMLPTLEGAFARFRPDPRLQGRARRAAVRPSVDGAGTAARLHDRCPVLPQVGGGVLGAGGVSLARWG